MKKTLEEALRLELKQYFAAVRAMEQRLEVTLPPLALVPFERMERQLEAGLPLLPLAPPALPVNEFMTTLGLYRDLLIQHNPALKDDLQAQAQAISDAAPSLQAAIVQALLLGDNGALFDRAQELGIAPEQLYFLGELALRPYLGTYAERIETVIQFDRYGGGRCPVCGRRPHIALIDGENIKYLHCQACEASWRVARIACTTCGCTDTPKLGFFTVEGNDEMRVEHCDECGDYLKVVNQRLRARKLDFLIEDAATVHLDQLAEAEGYVRGGRNRVSQ